MANFVVVSRTSLRPDPDDTSQEVVGLKVNDTVAGLHQLATWEKASFTDPSGRSFLGWVHLDALKAVQASQFNLYNEPLGQSTLVTAELFEVKLVLSPWRKVRLLRADGSIIEGWLNDDDASAPQHEISGEDDGSDLNLGRNETYRPYLLKAQRIADIDAAALAALIDAEAAKLPSGQWNANSTAGSSSAAGLTQFLATTWISHAQKTGTLLNQFAKQKGYVNAASAVAPDKERALLDLRFDPELSIVSAAEYGRINLDALIKAGLVSDQIGDDEKARFIYLAHHEGPAGAEGFLKGTSSYTFSNLVTQVGSSKAQTYVNAANGDTTKAYKNWLGDYLDEHIQPSKFRKPTTGPLTTTGGTVALAQFDGPPTPLAELSNKPGLAKAIQWRLSELGYLDPPADGKFLQVSHWALGEFCDQNGVSLSGGFTNSVAQRLLAPTTLLPEVSASGNWFGKVIDYMNKKKYFICRHPDCKNIIYLEGVNPDGSLNDDIRNVFNDLRIVFTVDKNGKPDFSSSIWEGTTEPGDFWTFHPMNPKGAARIAFNQYKAWVVGTHKAGTPQAHEALTQAEPVSVHRDLNMDFKRPGDKLDTGDFGINQHWGYDAPLGDLGNTSAGCLVGRTKAGHRKFMELVKDDPRYKVNNSYKFVTAVMPGDEILAR